MPTLLWAALVSLAAVAASASGTSTGPRPAEPLGTGCSFLRLAARPRLFGCLGFAGETWVEALRLEAEEAIAKGQDCVLGMCRTYVQDADLGPSATAFLEALYALLPAEAAAEARAGYSEQPLNVVAYASGGQTGGAKGGWHHDPGKRHPRDLLASAILYIVAPEKGGETSFKLALPAPVVVPPRGGNLAVFISCDEVGEDEELSLHKSMPVTAGRKLMLQKFFSLPRWFCTQNFTFSAPAEVTVLRETADETRRLAEQNAAEAAQMTEVEQVCMACLDSGKDYCGTWNKCIERAVRSCAKADTVTGDAEFAKKGFSMRCPKKDNLATGRRFLDEKSREEGIVKLASGLMYKVLRSGQGGASPSRTTVCEYHYQLQMIDGTVIASSFKTGKPEVDTPAGSIAGFSEALLRMAPGDMWVLYIPSELGYGQRGSGGVIPGGAALIFLVELLDTRVEL